MNVVDSYEAVTKALRFFGRAVSLSVLWVTVMVLSGGIRLPNLELPGILSARAFLKLDEVVKALGLEPKPIHYLVVSFIAYVIAFELLIGALYRLVPWRLTYTGSSFWSANKTWKEPREIALHSGLRIEEVHLGAIHNQFDLLSSRYKEEFPENYQSSVEWLKKRNERWAALAIGISGLLLCTILLLLVHSFLGEEFIDVAGIIGGALLLAALGIVTRIIWEAGIEKEFKSRAQFVLSCFAQDDRQWDRDAGDVRIFEQHLAHDLAGSPSPGLPYSGLWLVHWIRQLPLMGSLGAYPWRPVASLQNDHDVPPPVRVELDRHRSYRVPHTFGERFMALLVERAVRAGWLRDDGPIAGGRVRRSDHELRTER